MAGVCACPYKHTEGKAGERERGRNSYRGLQTVFRSFSPFKRNE